MAVQQSALFLVVFSANLGCAVAISLKAITDIDVAAHVPRGDPPTATNLQGLESHTVFASHHKTGTLLGRKLNICLAKDAAAKRKLQFCVHEREADHWEGQARGCKIVHLVRSPFEMIRSSYLYSLQTPPAEDWMRDDLTSDHGYRVWMFNKTQWIEAVPNKPQNGEGITDYYNRVSLHDGIVAEMLGVGDMVVSQMEEAWKATKHNNDVLTVPLENFFRDFNGTVRQVFKFLDVEPEDSIWACVGEQDPSLNTFVNHLTPTSHTTSGTVSDAKKIQILSDIAEVDGSLSQYGDVLKNRRFSQSPMKNIFKHGGAELQEVVDVQHRDAWMEVMA